MIVLRRGTEYTDKGEIPFGGQTIPSSIVGERAAS